MGSASTTPVVSRHYEASPAFCEKAVELLLKGTVNKKKGGPETAPDDGTKVKEDSADVSSLLH